MPNKVSSNISGLSIAEEQSLKVLPGTPVWYGQEPNSYDDFGGESTSVRRAPIDPSRQNKKGTVVDLDADGGFNTDFTKSNLARLLQGFFFTDVAQLQSSAPLNAASVPFTSTAAADKSYNAAAGLPVMAAGNLVLASGFTNAANNGLKQVATSIATKLTVVEVVVDEAAPPVAAKVERVGHHFAVADINLTVTSGIPALTATAADFTTIGGFFPGNWIFIGGDLAAHRFANNIGYARIATVAAKAVTFDETTFTPVTESGAGKTIRVFNGFAYRNQKDPALIKRRSYNVERTLGVNDTAGVMAEYLEGAVPNELTVNIPKSEKLTVDLSFVAVNHKVVSGVGGDVIKAGTRISALGEEAFNTSRDIVRIKMAILDPATSNPTALFGYVDEASLTVNNNITPNKAVGVVGAFDTTEGNFDVGGSVTAFFSSTAAVAAIRNNADVAFSIIAASKNSGIVFDMPLVGLGGGRLSVEKDSAIMLPLEASAAENSKGYTAMAVLYPYLPTVAMPA